LGWVWDCLGVAGGEPGGEFLLEGHVFFSFGFVIIVDGGVGRS
jgi:hypothetical protein